MEYVYRVNFLISFLIASVKTAWPTITTPEDTNLFAIVFAIDSKFPLVVVASKISVMIGIKNEYATKSKLELILTLAEDKNLENEFFKFLDFKKFCKFE